VYKFQVLLNDDDFYEYNKHHQINSPAGKSGLLLYRIIVPLATLCIFTSIIAIFQTVLGSYLTVTITVFITYFVTMTVFLIFSKRILLMSQKSGIKRMKKNGKLPYEPEYEIAFYDDCVINTSRNMTTRFSYSIVERVDKGDKAIYIYINVNMAQIIPLAIFPGESEKRAFLEYLRSRCAFYSVFI